jgi:hypothetical protein
MITANFHDLRAAEHRILTGHDHDSLSFVGERPGEYITLFVPPHVAEHTAAAFNRAMQAVPDSDGWTYTTKSGVWYIDCDPSWRSTYFAHHESVTGDNDPGYLFAQGNSLIGCMDVIDNIEQDETCTECHALVGPNGCTEMHDDRYLCDDCLRAEVKRLAELQEMADDDRAHAMMERAAQ